MKKILSLFCFAILVSCCSHYKTDIDYIADKQREKLREHFSGGVKVRRCGQKAHALSYDLHSLITETRYVASRLRASGRIKEANEFDSYVDVLMFGNRTVDESIRDVVKLVNGDTKKRGMYDRFIGIFCD